MNTVWLIVFALAMFGGIIDIGLLVLSFLIKKLKSKRKVFAIILGVAFVMFWVSAFAYDATLSEEQRIEIEKRQLIKEQNEQLAKQKENQADKELVEVEESSEMQEKSETVESSEMQEQLEVVESYTEEISTEESVSEQNIPEQKQSVCEETSIQEEICMNEDWEFLTRDGHPTYYGNMQEAKWTWVDVSRKKILYAGSYLDFTDKTILVLDGYHTEDNEIIRDIEIYFENFSEPMDIYLEDALWLTSGYIPYDIIDEWYEFSSSYKAIPEDLQEQKEKYYVIEYALTEEGGEAYYDDKHSFSGRITIIITEELGKIKTVTMHFGVPKWMNSLERNSYIKEEWHYDFLENNINE